MINCLKEHLNTLGLSLTSLQEQQFEVYFNMLTEWNSSVNLTAITSPQDVALKHFADSLAPLAICSELFAGERSVIDIGAGAGFPSVPLKIMRPSLSLTMLDSLNKRIAFLDALTDKLGLEKVQTIHSRAEDAAHDPMLRESFDLCVARAVAPMRVLCEYALPFVKPSGCFAAYKGPSVNEELTEAENAVTLLGGRKAGTFFVDFHTDEMSRYVVLIKKLKNTPSKYPRSAGTPKKHPL